MHGLIRPAGTFTSPGATDPAPTTTASARSVSTQGRGLGKDGTILTQVKQPGSLDFGIYAHQVRVDPSDKTVILVTRGNGPAGGKPEDPGALKVFGYKDGILTNRASIAPNRGFGFQPRHLDFHPSRPWVFVTLERQNKLQVYQREPDGNLGSAPLFTK